MYISDKSMQALRRAVTDLKGLIAGRSDVPAHYHEDVAKAEEALDNPGKPMATANMVPAKSTAAAPAEPEEKV